MKRENSFHLMKVIIFVMAWIFSFCIFAQNITVKGNITDVKGELLIRVTI